MKTYADGIRDGILQARDWLILRLQAHDLQLTGEIIRREIDGLLESNSDETVDLGKEPVLAVGDTPTTEIPRK